MAAIAIDTLRDRREHQQHVANLLDRIEQARRRLYLLRAAGVRPAALGGLKGDLLALRRELATTVAARRGSSD
jgi:hypothetical protein